MSRIVLEQATQQNIEEWYGGRPPYSMRGLVARRIDEDGSELLGIGGLFMYHGKPYLFCEMKECAKRYRKYILKAAREVLRMVDGKIVYAVPQPELESAPRFLEHLGFELINKNSKLYRRSNNG